MSQMPIIVYTALRLPHVLSNTEVPEHPLCTTTPAGWNTDE